MANKYDKQIEAIEDKQSQLDVLMDAKREEIARLEAEYEFLRELYSRLGGDIMAIQQQQIDEMKAKK